VLLPGYHTTRRSGSAASTLRTDASCALWSGSIRRRIMNINNKELSEPEVKAYIHKLEDLLRETRPVLRTAIFVNYKDTNKANEIYNRINKLVGKE
jgi:hypothetical protein